ncbi:Myosin-like protein, partial [Globisporangium splendens]
MLLKRKTTDKQLLTIYHGQHLDKHVNYTKPWFECDEFVIRHYAGEVVYDIHDFIAKNTDNLHDDLLDLLKRSSQTLVHAIFGAIPDAKASQKRGAPASGGSNNKGKQGATLTGTSTVTSRFRTQLTESMDVLWNTTPNYIKCIKPNNLRFPGGFSCELVCDQLIYSSVLGVVRIRQEGFPIRKRFDVFYELFRSLAIAKYSVVAVRNDTKLLREACESISAEWLEGERANPSAGGEVVAGKRVFAMGRQEVFLRYGQVEKLEAFVASLRSEKAVVIQAKLVRCRIAYKRYQALQKGMRKLQALWRMHTSRTRYIKMKKSSVHIQATFRCFKAQTRLQKLKCAANCVFRATMRFLTHKSFVVWEKQSKAAIMIQKHLRDFLSRTAVERAKAEGARNAIIKIQSEYRSVEMRREFLVPQEVQDAQASRGQAAGACVEMETAPTVQKIAISDCVSPEQAAPAAHDPGTSATPPRDADDPARNERMELPMQFITMTKRLRMLQYWAKSWLMRKEYRYMRVATMRIQRAWQKHHRVKRWENEVDTLENGGIGSKNTETAPASESLFPVAAQGVRLQFLVPSRCGDFHVVKYMLEHTQGFLAKHELFHLKNGKGNTAFHEGCGHGQCEMVKFLMIQARIIVDEERNKPLERVCSTTNADAMVRHDWQPHDDTNNNSNQSQDYQNYNQVAADPDEPLTKDPSAPPKKANEEPQEDVAPDILYSDYLRKRRETSRWMRRFVVLNVDSETRFPQLEYFANDKPATLQGKSSKRIDLRVALSKKSTDAPFAFEIHSTHSLEGHNKEGRLYFAAENELEIQKWLAHLRNSISSSIESRIFAMHRGSKYGKLEFVQGDTTAFGSERVDGVCCCDGLRELGDVFVSQGPQ